MDFKRIERILIVAFFLLNIFLISIVLDQQNVIDFSSPSQSINILDEMANNNITVEELDQDEWALPYVQAENHQLLEESESALINQTGSLNEDNSLYVSVLSSPVELSDEEGLTEADRKKLDDFVNSDAVLYGEHYGFFDYHPHLQEVIYTQMVNGIPIADGTSSLRLILDSQNNLISYEQTLAGPVSKQGEEVPLISDQAAVEILFQNNKIPSGATVFKPQITYHRTLSLDELSIYIPVWYVKIQHSSEVVAERVNATDGTIISPTPPPQAEEEEEDSSQQ